MLKHCGTVTLDTERLRLRRFVLSDAEDMFRYYAQDERVTKFLSWTPYTSVSGVKKFLANVTAQYQADNYYHWAIELEGKTIGSISAISIDDKNHSCEIGYCIGYDFWNMGLMSEAVRAVISFFFERTGMHRIVAKHDAENPASGKVMIKCAMKYEGTLREGYLRHDGTYSDALLYSVLIHEYKSCYSGQSE